MGNRYEQFLEHFRDLLLVATGYTEDKIYVKSGKDTVEDDRMVVECAREGEFCQVCALHTKKMFDLYCDGMSMEAIVSSAVESLALVDREELFQTLLNINDYSMVEDELFIRLLNYDRNRKELEDAIYRKLGDIVLVLYMRVGEQKDFMTSMKVKKPLVKKWGLSESEVFEKAMLNTYFMSPPRIFSWEKMLYEADYDGENFMNLCEEFHIKKDSSGNCLSTTARTNGAVAIFLPGVAKRLANLMGSGYYVAFTSIHEAMIHNDQMVSVETLRKILMETVKEATPEEDFLSYQIYHYEYGQDKFTCQ